jgi:Flp pilus assembly pilin Flp
MPNTETDNSPAEQGRIRCEEGQALAEYALILAAVSIMAVGLTPVGQWCAVRFVELASAL